jgi:hypothetical protein
MHVDDSLSHDLAQAVSDQTSDQLTADASETETHNVPT